MHKTGKNFSSNVQKECACRDTALSIIILSLTAKKVKESRKAFEHGLCGTFV